MQKTTKSDAASLHGVLAVYKEEGYTSNDVVAKLRGILHMKKIGHTGTLDPAAKGVLPVCLGKGTKIISLLEDTDKTYECSCRLGITTDTEDMTGKVLTRSDTGSIRQDDIIKTLLSFEGEYMQIPPMYSAKKVNGKKLYELAREGIEIERKPCRVYIRSVRIKDIRPEDQTFSFEVSCSKGTYIRSLCRDIGEKLGCGACMQSLLRTRACGMGIDECLKLSDIEELSRAGEIEKRIKKIDEMFPDLPQIRVDEGEDKGVINGNVLSIPKPDGRYRVYLSDGRFAAIYEIRDKRADLCGYFLT